MPRRIDMPYFMMEWRLELLEPWRSRYDNAYNILKILEKGKKFGNRRMKNVILVLGNREARKSIITQFIASDNVTKRDIMKYNSYKTNKTDFSNGVLPKLIQDFENGVTFCDCPEFSDDLVQEITGTFFIKNIIDSADSIKFVFTVDYSLLEGNEKEIDCWSFLKYPIKLVNNFENFKNSMGFVVTNVDHKLRTNNSMIVNKIRSILENCKEDIIQSIDSEYLRKNATRFMDNLLSKDDNNQHTRIGVFTRFDDSTLLSDITLLQNDKNSLKKMLHNNMKFSTHGDNDIKYAITNSTEVKQVIDVVVGESEENIVLGIKNITLKIKKYFFDQEKQSRNIDELYKIFSLPYDLSCENIECFKKNITKFINDFNITIFNTDFSYIDIHVKFLKFIQSTNQISSRLWIEGLTDFDKYLNDSCEWYNFLKVLDDTFAEYDVQKYIQSQTYPTSIIYRYLEYEKTETLIEQYSSAEISIILDGLESTIHKLDTKSIQKLKNICHKIRPMNITLNSSKLKFLDVILDQALKYPSSISCEDNNNLVMKGNYLMLSSVLRAECSQAKLIKIFSLKKFYLDTNYIRTGEEVKLFIIAPEWEVNSTYISLSGLPFFSTKTSYKRSMDAGDFVGISGKIVKNLEVYVKGGYNYTEEPKNLKCIDEMKSIFLNYTDQEWNKVCKNEFIYKPPGSIGTCYLYPANCSFQTSKGRKGYNILITPELQPNRVFEKSMTPKLLLKYRSAGNSYDTFQESRFLPQKACKSLREIKKGRCVEIQFVYNTTPDSYDLTKDVSIEYLREFDMELQTTTIFDILPTVINNYKSYAIENLNNSIRETYLGELLNEIDKNDIHDTLGFVNELQDLEEKFVKLRKNILLRPFYQSLLKRIMRYEEKHRNSEKLTEYDKNILNRLRASILSNINFYNYNTVNEFSRNLPMELNDSINNMKKIINRHKFTRKNNYKKKYLEKQNTKINETYSSITNVIMPEINNRFAKIDIAINSLFLETNNTIHKIEEEKEKLREQKNLVIGNIIGKTIFTLAHLAASTLFFLGPLGIAIGLGVQGILTTAENIVIKDPSPVHKVKLPSGVTNALREEYYKEKTLFKRQLKETKGYLEEQIAKDPTIDMSKVKNKITDTLEKLENEDKTSTNFDENSSGGWHKDKTDVTETIKQQITQLVDETVPDKVLRDKQLKMLNKVQIGVSAGLQFTDYVMSVVDDAGRIDVINDAIEMADAKEHLLEEYEKIIRKTMIPMNHKVKADIENAIVKLVDASYNDLVKTRLKIKDMLRHAEMEWKKKTEDFSVRDELIECFKGLDFAVTEIFKMYEYIQHLEELKEFANYIADMTVSDEYHSQHEISDSIALQNLTSIIQFNTVLNEYEHSINAFKHEVFPFANDHLKNINLPLSWKRDETYESMIKMVEVVEELRKELTKFRQGNNDYRTFVHGNVTFGCNSKIMSPFYVWEYSRNKLDILNLLEGKEVVLKSDIGHGIDRNAVKFNIIRIRFSLENKLKQYDFDRVLESFQVTMKHHGTSYYRCDSKFYTISTTDTDVFKYYYNTNCGIRPESPNKMYDHTAAYDPVLSPYAIWSIKLTEKDHSGTYNELSEYKDEEMDLYLEGIGEYLELNSSLCNDNLDNYYIEDDSTTEIDFIDFDTGNRANLYKGIRDKYLTENVNYENNMRVRRDVDQSKFISSIDKSLYASNGGLNSKPSIINNLFNLIGSSIEIFRYWMPINNMSQWFINNKENVSDVSDEKQLTINANHHIDIQVLNSQVLQKVPRIPNISFDHESPTTENTLNTSLFCSNANLLFLDSVIRWKNGKKHKQQYSVINNDSNVQYAHHLAYGAQAHDYIAF